MQGFNKYYPPDFDPKVHKTANGYVGKDVRVKTVRIELPWAVFCGHCRAHVAKGVRYNAVKKAVGFYHSTKILEFHMTCHLCSGPMVMKTDPEHRDYAVVSGMERKTQTYDAEDAQVLSLPDDKEKKRLATDAFYKLEHVSTDKKVAVAKDDLLEKLIDLKSEQFEDDYHASRIIRNAFRKRKGEEVAEEKKNKSKGIHVQLLPEAEEDVRLAKATKFSRKIALKKTNSIFGKTKK